MLIKNTTPNKSALLLLSGGIDSTTLLAQLSAANYSIIALSFDYGQKHKIELQYAAENAKKYSVKKHLVLPLPANLFSTSALTNPSVEVDKFNKDNILTINVNTYVPFRNMVFLSTALSLAESENIKEIYVAFNQDDSIHYWDCSETFLAQMNNLAQMNTTIKIKAPFIKYTKNEVIALAYKLEVDINATITCYQPQNAIECGACLSCISKKNALYKLV